MMRNETAAQPASEYRLQSRISFSHKAQLKLAV